MTFFSASKLWSSIDLKFILFSTPNFNLEIPSNLDGFDVAMPPNGYNSQNWSLLVRK